MLGNLKFKDYNPVKTYSYKYPRKRPLVPGTELHDNLVKMVFEQAKFSYESMQKRHEVWRKIDENLTGYVPLDESEVNLKDRDPRKPVSIVIPMSFYTLDTFLMYYASEFLDYPVFVYEGQSPADQYKGFLLTEVMKRDAYYSGLLVKLFVFFKDITKYGFGVIGVNWKKEEKLIRNTWNLTYDGNEYFTIDPYLFLPDPDVPLEDGERGNFRGFIEQTNYFSILSDEQQDISGELFNAKYIADKPRRDRNPIMQADPSGRSTKYSNVSRTDERNDPVDIIHMYVKLIPKELRLGTNEYPEWWLISITTSGIVIRAMPMDQSITNIPLFVGAPDTDGYSIYPTSRIELNYGSQEAVDWLMSSHIHNVRKSVNDMWLVDPGRVNMRDVLSPGPGKMIRLKSDLWGQGIENAIKPFEVKNVTQQNLIDIDHLLNLNNQFIGPADSISGIWRKGSERVSATEASGTMKSALSRLERVATIVNHQVIAPLGMLSAYNMQDYMSHSVWVKLTAEWQRYLSQFTQASKTLVDRDDIDIPIDIVPKQLKSKANKVDDPQAYLQALSIATNSMELQQEYSISKLYAEVLRTMGITNVEDLRRTDINFKALPEETIQEQASKGNVVPVKELNNAAS